MIFSAFFVPTKPDKMIAIKDNTARANAVKIIFYMMMAMDIISVYSNILQYMLLKAGQEGGSITPEAAEVNDTRQQVIAVIMLALIIATIISFIMWFHRAYKNLHAMNTRILQFTPGWAIGAWFVPILNLGRPFVIMKEIWEETQSASLPTEEKHLVSPTTIIGWWWAFWIMNSIIGNASGRITRAADSIDGYLFSTGFSIFSDSVDMIAMILTLVMINRMTEYEKRLAAYVKYLNSLPPESSEPVSGEALPSAPSM